MTKKRLLYGTLVFALICLGTGIYVVRQATPGETRLSFPDSAFHFEIVTSPEAQERGLGGRPRIPDNYGMLFVFTKKDRYGFWMKDMLTSIDIIWLADDRTIVKIDGEVDPSTYPKAYYPPEPVKYVIETRAGYAKLHGWGVGTKVSLPSPYSAGQ